MKLFATVYHDASLLGHFAQHYSEAGVSHFYLAIDPERVDAVADLARRFPITFVSDLDVAESVFGVAAVTSMRDRHQEPDEWVVIVDLDEFVECDDLASVAAACERFGGNLVRGIMYDRFSVDGQPRAVTPSCDLDAVFPIKAPFVRNVMGGSDHKGVLVKGHLRPAKNAAHHRFEAERTYSRVLDISHYKWTAGAIEQVRDRRDRLRSGGSPWAEEYDRVLAHYDLHRRFAWETFGGSDREEFDHVRPQVPTCSLCGGAISVDEHDFSVKTFGMALCRADQDLARAQLDD